MDRLKVVPVYGLTPYSAKQSHGASRELVRAFGTESERYRRCGPDHEYYKHSRHLLIVAAGLCSLVIISESYT